MHAHGIEILDRTDDDDVIFGIAHHLKFKFLPSEHRLFDQRLVHRRHIQTAGQHLQKLFAVIGDAAAGASQRERRPHDYGKANLARKFQPIFGAVHQRRLGHVEPDLLHRVFEEETVFGFLNGRDIRANQAHVIFFQNAAVGKFDCQIQRSLSAHRR